jgi:dynein intermediate chain
LPRRRATGTINIWNLATTLDQPVSGTEGIPINGGAHGDPSSSSYQGLNRSSDGRRLAVASDDKLQVLSVGEHVWKAKGDEEGRVMHYLISRGLIQQD